MTVQPTWSARIATTLALLLAALGLTLLPATPAAAGPTDLSVSASGGVTLQVGGGDKIVNFTITNNGGPADDVKATIDVPLTGDGVRISQGTDGCKVNRGKLQCEFDRIGVGRQERLFVRLSPPGSGGPGPGENRQGQGQISVQHDSDDPNPDNNTAGYGVTLKGPDRPQGVASVSGVVKNDKSGKPVADAKVEVTDSKGATKSTATNDNGQFKVSSTQDKPIAAGSLSVSVSKGGYTRKTLTKSGRDGESVKINFAIAKKAASSPSASESVTASEPAGVVDDDKAAPAADEGINWGLWLASAFGILLVLGGIGAIVMLFARRRDEDADDLDEYGDERPHPARARAGGYADETRVDYPDDLYGADRYTPSHTTPLEDARPTTVMGAAGYGPGVEQPTSMIDRGGIDQPTSMMDRGVDQPTRAHSGPAPDDYGARGHVPPDEYGRHGDPGYGVQHEAGGYGPGDQGYGSARSGGYEAGGSEGGGYGAPRYGAQDPGYGAQGAGYGAQDPGYGAQDPGYGRGGGYGGREGHGAQGYGAQDYGAQGHGAPDYGGRGDDYGTPGHGGQAGSYGDPGTGPGGRHSSGAEYDPQSDDRRAPRRGGGRHSAGDEDRRLDWYDD